MNELAHQDKSVPSFTFNDMVKMADVVIKSKLFGMHDHAQALALLMLCQAQGLHPMVAVQKYHIIQGRPSMKAEAMLADFQAAGGRVKWLERSDKQVKAEFSHPSGGSLTVSWSLDDAAKIIDSKSGKSLTDKDNWKNYPRQMLSARVVSEGIRAVCPQIIQGVYTPEEIQDFAPVEKEVNGTPTPAQKPSPESKSNTSEKQQEKEPERYTGGSDASGSSNGNGKRPSVFLNRDHTGYRNTGELLPKEFWDERDESLLPSPDHRIDRVGKDWFIFEPIDQESELSTQTPADRPAKKSKKSANQLGLGVMGSAAQHPYSDDDIPLNQ